MEFEFTVRIKAPSLLKATTRMGAALEKLPRLAERELNGELFLDWSSVEDEVDALTSVLGSPKIISVRVIESV